MANKRRPQGDGTIRKRKDGRWEGRITIGHKNDGSPIYKSVFGKTQKSTLKQLHQMIDLYRDVDLTEECRMTLGEWMDKWLDEYMIFTVKGNTIKGYRAQIDHQIKRFIGHKRLASLTTSEIQKFYNKIKKEGRVKPHPLTGYELSDSVVRGVHMILHQALDMAVKERLIVRNPTNGTTIPKKTITEKQVLDDGQLDRFMNAIKEEPYWNDFFYVEIMTGMRRGEILGLKWKDLNVNDGSLQISREVVLARGKIFVQPPKTKSSTRTIVLPPYMVEILAEMKKTKNCEWIFPSPVKEGEPRHPTALHHRLKLILERSGCKDIRFHDLRHTFATMALENGMDVKTLSDMIGHISAENTLNIYSHITDTMRAQASVKIDRKIGGIDAPMPEPKDEPKSTQINDVGENFEPYTPKIRKSGTGCVYQVNEHLWEGSFYPRLPNGKRKKFNVYAKTREECEDALAKMIAEKKAEIAEMKKTASS